MIDGLAGPSGWFFYSTSAGVAHATALSWEPGWVWDIPDGLTHVFCTWWQLLAEGGSVLPDSASPAGWPGLLTWRFRLREQKQMQPDLLMPQLRSYVATLPMNSVGPSRSQSQPRFQGRGNRLTVPSFGWE